MSAQIKPFAQEAWNTKDLRDYVAARNLVAPSLPRQLVVARKSPDLTAFRYQLFQ